MPDKFPCYFENSKRQAFELTGENTGTGPEIIFPLFFAPVIAPVRRINSRKAAANLLTTHRLMVLQHRNSRNRFALSCRRAGQGVQHDHAKVDPARRHSLQRHRRKRSRRLRKQKRRSNGAGRCAASRGKLRHAAAAAACSAARTAHAAAVQFAVRRRRCRRRQSWRNAAVKRPAVRGVSATRRTGRR